MTTYESKTPRHAAQMRYLLWLGIAAVALCIIHVFVRYRAQRKITILTNIPTVEKDIRSHLPIGTPRATVEEYLTRHAIEHSYLQSKPGPGTQRHGDRADSRSVPDLARSK